MAGIKVAHANIKLQPKQCSSNTFLQQILTVTLDSLVAFSANLPLQSREGCTKNTLF
eukprot:m.227492 g.227492  ORF g.227492 m.227492 type:complete len:57 (-) comp19243_c0_seq3:2337-2507(-)